MRGKFFTMRVGRCWHRLLTEAVDAPSPEVFKSRLDGALGSLVECQIWRLVPLPVAGGLELDDPWSPFQPKPFCDSMIPWGNRDVLFTEVAIEAFPEDS